MTKVKTPALPPSRRVVAREFIGSARSNRSSITYPLGLHILDPSVAWLKRTWWPMLRTLTSSVIAFPKWKMSTFSRAPCPNMLAIRTGKIISTATRGWLLLFFSSLTHFIYIYSSLVPRTVLAPAPTPTRTSTKSTLRPSRLAYSKSTLTLWPLRAWSPCVASFQELSIVSSRIASVPEYPDRREKRRHSLFNNSSINWRMKIKIWGCVSKALSARNLLACPIVPQAVSDKARMYFLRLLPFTASPSLSQPPGEQLAQPKLTW